MLKPAKTSDAFEFMRLYANAGHFRECKAIAYVLMEAMNADSPPPTCIREFTKLEDDEVLREITKAVCSILIKKCDEESAKSSENQSIQSDDIA